MCLCALCHDCRIVDANGHVCLDLAGKSAQNLIQRKIGALADDVMACQVDGCLCSTCIRYGTVHHGIDCLHVTRVHADKLLLQTLYGSDGSIEIFTGDQRSRRALTITGDAGIGLNLNQAADRVSDEAQRNAERTHQRHLHSVGLNVGNFHDTSIPP